MILTTNSNDDCCCTRESTKICRMKLAGLDEHLEAQRSGLTRYPCSMRPSVNGKLPPRTEQDQLLCNNRQHSQILHAWVTIMYFYYGGERKIGENMIN